jgi:hypothetical protein
MESETEAAPHANVDMSHINNRRSNIVRRSCRRVSPVRRSSYYYKCVQGEARLVRLL